MTDQESAAAAFFEAIRKGNDLDIDTALAANEGLLHARDEAGLSPVLAAAYAGRSKLAMRLAALAAGTPDGLDFFDAAAVGNVTVVRALLTADRASVDDRGPDGYTALHLAAYFAQLEVARLLLGRGADPRDAAAQRSRRQAPRHGEPAVGPGRLTQRSSARRVHGLAYRVAGRR
jgi:ankyrin repeat protein